MDIKGRVDEQAKRIEKKEKMSIQCNVKEPTVIDFDPTTGERILDNGAALFPIEMPAVETFVPDRDRMRASGVPLIVVVGEVNRDTWFGAAATWLAQETGADLVELSGGHVGYLTHPKEFVALISHTARTNERSQP